MRYTLEVCVDSLVSAKNAELGGATRLELCENLVIGGTTPSPAFFQQVKKAVTIPVHILVRPRFGDFLYSQAEIERVAQEIEDLYRAGGEAFVIGALTAEGELDEAAIRLWMEAAPKAKFVCHRAIDMAKDRAKALAKLIEMGFCAVLTSGGEGDATSGAEAIGQMVQSAKGQIEIIVGAGVNASNIAGLAVRTGAAAFHMSGKAELDSKMKYRNPKVFMGLPGLSEYTIFETQTEEIRRAATLLNELAVEEKDGIEASV